MVVYGVTEECVRVAADLLAHIVYGDIGRSLGDVVEIDKRQSGESHDIGASSAVEQATGDGEEWAAAFDVLVTGAAVECRRLCQSPVTAYDVGDG